MVSRFKVVQESPRANPTKRPEKFALRQDLATLWCDRSAIAHGLVASGFLRRMLNALDLALADGALAPSANVELEDRAREGRKERILWREREKKREISHPSGPHPSGAHPSRAPHFVVPKFNIQKLAEVEIGPSRN